MITLKPSSDELSSADAAGFSERPAIVEMNILFLGRLFDPGYREATTAADTAGT